MIFGLTAFSQNLIMALNQFILKIPNSTSNLDVKLGNDIDVGWNAKDSRALDPK